MLFKKIYLDNASTTPMSAGVKRVITEYLDDYANPNSVHIMGELTNKTMLEDKEIISNYLFGEASEHIIITSSGSEANTMAIVGLEQCLRKAGKNKIITSRYEHSSVLNAMKEMARRGFQVEYLDVKDGYVNPMDLQNAIDENTGLVSIMYVNNEIGTTNCVRKMSKICKEKGTLFHTDCVQAATTLDISPKALGADLISVSGHKLHAPKGIGVLYAKNLSIINPVIFGGQQEQGFRGGTENTLYIRALAQAVKENKKFMQKDMCGLLYDYLKEFLVKNIKGVHLNAPSNSLKRILSVRFDGVDAETLVLMLSNKGIMVSAGSACDSRSSEPSHALLAIGLTDNQARETIRISFGKYNTMQDVKYAAGKIKQCVEAARNLRGFTNRKD